MINVQQTTNLYTDEAGTHYVIEDYTLNVNEDDMHNLYEEIKSLVGYMDGHRGDYKNLMHIYKSYATLNAFPAGC